MTPSASPRQQKQCMKKPADCPKPRRGGRMFCRPFYVLSMPTSGGFMETGT